MTLQDAYPGLAPFSELILTHFGQRHPKTDRRVVRLSWNPAAILEGTGRFPRRRNVPPESEQPQAKQVPLRTLLVTLLIVALIAVFLVWWKGGEAVDRICRPLIDAAVARAEPDVEAELPMIVEEVGGSPAEAREIAERERVWTELSGAPPVWPENLSAPPSCEDVESDLLAVCRELDTRPFVRERLTTGGICTLVRQVGEELAANPPVPTSELGSYASILANVFHLSRTLGLKRVELLRDALVREPELREPAAMALYRWSVTRRVCAERTSIRREPIYDYSVFLLNTVGGQAYLRRRSPDIEALASFYALVTLDRAIEDGHNPHGVDPRPDIQRCRELIETQPFVFREGYLGILDEMEQRWASRESP